jgi:hypothetical protein
MITLLKDPRLSEPREETPVPDPTMRSIPKPLRPQVRALLREGWTLEMSGSSKPRLRSPDRTTIVPVSTDKLRGPASFRQALRRHQETDQP